MNRIACIGQLPSLLFVLVGVLPGIPSPLSDEREADIQPLQSHIEPQLASTVRFLFELSTRETGRFPAGMGVALAFDSKRLVFEDFERRYERNLLGASPEAEADWQDLDQNPETDRLIRLAWIEPGGQWLASVQPVNLLRARFRCLPIASGAGKSESAALNVAPLNGDGERTFETIRHEIDCLSGAPLASEEALRKHRDPQAADAESKPVPQPLSQRILAPSPGQEQGAACSLDVDGNGQLDALSDGILILRYLFGASGNSLTSNAIGMGAVRTNSNQIIGFLEGASCRSMLDVDGNGRADALTDGILVLRYLFGFGSSSLTINALGAGATRSTPEAVVAWLENFRATGASKQATIGSAGGTASLGDLQVQFPSGAVQTSAVVRITSVQPDTGSLPGATPVSDAFSVQIDGAMTKPATLSIKPRTAPTDPVFAAITMPYGTMYNKSAGSKVFIKDVYFINGAYQLAIPANSNPAAASGRWAEQGNPQNTFTIYIFAGYGMKSTQHFNLRYPLKTCNLALMTEWVQMAENAYNLLVNQMNYKTGGLGFDVKRMSLDVAVLASTLYGECGYSAVWGLGTLDATVLEFNLNSLYCNDTSDAVRLQMQTTIPHEFFHAIQYTYDPAPALVETIWGSRGLCLYDASSSWLEGEVLGNPAYLSIPSREQIFEGNPFYARGLGYGCATDAQNYGYGAATLVRYLTGRYGRDALLAMWTQFNSGRAFCPADAVELSGFRLAESWEDFSTKLVLGTTGYNWGRPRPMGILSFQAGKPIALNQTMYQLSTTNHTVDFRNLASTGGRRDCTMTMPQGAYTTAHLFYQQREVAVATTAANARFAAEPSNEYTLIVVNSNDSSGGSYTGIRYASQNPMSLNITCQEGLSVEPGRATPGDTVTFRGADFGPQGDTRVVTFYSNEIAGSVQWVNSGEIRVVVPALALSGNVRVEVNGRLVGTVFLEIEMPYFKFEFRPSNCQSSPLGAVRIALKNQNGNIVIDEYGAGSPTQYALPYQVSGTITKDQVNLTFKGTQRYGVSDENGDEVSGSFVGRLPAGRPAWSIYEGNVQYRYIEYNNNKITCDTQTRTTTGEMRGCPANCRF